MISLEPTIDKKIFEKYDLLPLYPSRINSWRDFPCGFVLKYIYGYDFPTNPKMHRGTSIELGIHYMFSHEKNIHEGLEKALSVYDDMAKWFKDQDSAMKERELLESYFMNSIDYLEPYRRYYSCYQMEVNTKILGIPFSGKTDFIFKDGDKYKVIDLKTKSRLEKRHSDFIQQAINKKGLLETVAPENLDVQMLLVTPKKYDIIKIDDISDYMKEIEMSLISMANLFKICKSKENFASIVTPNLGDWHWYDEDQINARKEIWGV